MARQQRAEVARSAAGPGRGDLLGHQPVVAGLLDLAEHADRGVPEVGAVQPGQRERVGGIGPVRVVRDQRVRVNGFGPGFGSGELDRLELEITPTRATWLQS